MDVADAKQDDVPLNTAAIDEIIVRFLACPVKTFACEPFRMSEGVTANHAQALYTSQLGEHRCFIKSGNWMDISGALNATNLSPGNFPTVYGVGVAPLLPGETVAEKPAFVMTADHTKKWRTFFVVSDLVNCDFAATPVSLADAQLLADRLRSDGMRICDPKRDNFCYRGDRPIYVDWEGASLADATRPRQTLTDAGEDWNIVTESPPREGPLFFPGHSSSEDESADNSSVRSDSSVGGPSDGDSSDGDSWAGDMARLHVTGGGERPTWPTFAGLALATMITATLACL
jgi:hypothetical protein